MIRRTAFVFLGSLLAVAAAAAAQEPAGPAPPRTIHAVRVTEPLRIDGRLDEALYVTHPSTSDFIQVEPQEGAPATEKTEVWLAFDDDNVYVSFRCWESQPDRIVAKEMRRDYGNIWRGDDIVSCMFDTFHDRRNGVRVHGSTPSAAARTARWRTSGSGSATGTRSGTSRSGGSRAAGPSKRRFPFKSLRYRPGESQVWGFNAFARTGGRTSCRSWRRRRRRRGRAGCTWPRWRRTLVGLAVPAGAKNLEIKPYAISTATGSARRRDSGDAGRSHRRLRPGREIRRHAEPHRRPHLQHRLRAGRGRPAAGQPDAVQPVLSGKARVLPGEPGHLRASAPSQTTGAERRRRYADPLLQPAHRPRGRRVRADRRAAAG